MTRQSLSAGQSDIDRIRKLLQLDASPKTLEQLQRVMDFAFDVFSHQD